MVLDEAAVWALGPRFLERAMRVWELGRLHSHLKAILPHRALLRARRPFVRRLIPTFAASVVLACFFLCVSHSVASAQIILDGVINEPDWTKLGDSTGGPPPSFGAGNEINALYADI